MSLAREFWKRIESIHAVTYFAPESIAAAKAAGLRGFWMGYFGFRAAPLGRVSPGVVEAAFANFAPAMVRRSLPDAWDFAEPHTLLRPRAEAAAGALDRLAPELRELAPEIEGPLFAIVSEGRVVGRPLFAANRDLELPADAVARIWQLCTTLREHRGDGHVLALAAEDLDGCEAHQLLIAESGAPVELVRDNRGWSEASWDMASQRLSGRGLLTDGALTPAGQNLRGAIEARTDRLALAPILAAMTEAEAERLVRALTPVALTVASSGTLPFPNPMGLPRLGIEPV